MTGRPKRVAEAIKKEISLVLREQVSDPRIGFVSITDVEISPDLKQAKVFVSVLGDTTQRKSSLAGLNSAASFIKGEVGENLRLRYIPDLRFIYDESLERGSRVISLINKLSEEKKK
ncbi:MAG: 30S ribosome-binding factor RbfA [Candidatus Margulisiibacteriota bacterium]|nr:30S ribosome-binding factor RbfA [Candidatus Margulisiibacteriota bacterium]